MKEQSYQSKIIKAIESKGGVAINGNFTKAGTADLICGYPVCLDVDGRYTMYDGEEGIPVLLHLHIEVKTEVDYHRVFRSIQEVNGRYVFNEDTKSLKKHEFLQITKLNQLRDRGGLGLIAYDIKQVEGYMDDV